MVTKSRVMRQIVSGSYQAGTGPIASPSVSVNTGHQITRSFYTGWPVRQQILKQDSQVDYGRGAMWYVTHHDWGASFITEKMSVSSNLSDHYLVSQSGNILPPYWYSHRGPALLGWRTLPPAYTQAELDNAEQSLWTLGGKAVKAARPNKPSLDLPVLLGELRQGGIPTLIGSIARRSQNLRDVFRSGGKEYLNVQFGWAPLIRDLTELVKLISTSRRHIEQYERDIERLVRRRYHFPDQTEVTTGLEFTPTHAVYRPQSGTPWGSMPADSWTFSPSGQVPEQVNRLHVKTWFSGGFRFYHRSVPEALTELSLLEEKANLLMGTRLDPEILYNLAPWTWLLDWFINFGDAVANASALLSDDLVMQYGYLMRTTTQESTVTWPQGPYIRVPIGSLSSGWQRARRATDGKPSSSAPLIGAYSTTISKEIKQRGKASPFGFGLNPSDFTSDQWAILAALGISRL